MHYTYRNVNDAFYGIAKGICEGSIATKMRNSRNGTVYRVVGPATITYTHPKERVLFNLERDCNPFFHLYESLWMLAGRRDVKSLDRYNSRMKTYSDDGETFHGAYGYRWREAMGYDQVEWIYKILFNLPDDRRAVLQMWDAYEDGHSDLITGSRGGKDVPCNLSAVFEVDDRTLNMTVFNRSNDLLWGALGANAVHFSVLQEYLAAKLHIDVGHYNQISSNLHIYADRWKGPSYLMKETWGMDDVWKYPYRTMRLVYSVVDFDRELPLFVENEETHCKEPFLAEVAAPMCLAYRHHKERNYNLAFEAIERVQSEDWRIACHNWMIRRATNYRAKMYVRNEA